MSRARLGLGLSVLLFGCHPQKAQVVSEPPAPPNVGIDESALDKAAQPCDDFYEYACGTWLKRTEIPADRSAWGRGFSVIAEQNEAILKAALEEDAANKTPDALTKQLGDFYTSCMDEAGIEKNGKAELDAFLKPIDGVKDMPTLAKEVARQHLAGAKTLFVFNQKQDLKNATIVVGDADQGGLGLPDRDYYTEGDNAIRDAYVAHVEKMLVLSGVAPDAAKTQAAAIMRIEMDLAKVSWTGKQRRVPEDLYHRVELKGLVKLAPKFPWASFLKEMGVPAVTQINVEVPDFFAGLNKVLAKTPIADLRAYLRWQAIHNAATALSKPFVDENFAFYEKKLNGTDQILPRWKRCVEATDKYLGEASAQAFVKKTFSDADKASAKKLIGEIEKAMEENIGKLTWMDDATRKAALAKLAAIDNKVGYPDTWRDYSSVKIGRESFLANVDAAAEFDERRKMNKIGKPVARGDWDMVPQRVNAYYEPQLNEMVFPAGILKAPFYSPKASDAVNYGAIGMVMGHELTHGFDDEGRKYDPKGSLTMWWTPATDAEFTKRAQCVVDQFSSYEVVDGKHIDGKLTTGENLADLGGIKLAYAAYTSSHKPTAKPENGFSDEQLFFLGTAQAWCTNRRPALERARLITDPHSTPKYRINGPLSNLPEFAAAFQCKPGSKMVRENACVVW